jgi:outer membrane protein OmpA-like peptidoglycan-associated protein
MSMTRTLTALCVALLLPPTPAARTPPAASAPEIPLREGLTIVTAISNGHADLESIKRITHVDAAIVRLTYSTDLPPGSQDDPIAALLGGNCGPQPGLKPDQKVHASVVRTVRRADLESAHEYRQIFRICATSNESYPGSTAVGLSASMLRELNTQGHTRLSVVAGGPGAALTNLIGLLGGATPELDKATLASGVLTRVEQGTVPFKVLVNDEPVELPAVHARGRLGEGEAEFWILNDPANPLSLRWSIADGGERLQVIKISYPPPDSRATTTADAAVAATPSVAEKIERDLAKDGRTVIYGIYFDFASDRIKEESEPVLEEIAKVLQQNPSWSLTVEGHTDNIGGNPANLDLSKRRAAAVKQALVSRYKVDGTRLQTSGYGASRPKDTNDTLEGRARNRRVELAKVG